MKKLLAALSLLFVLGGKAHALTGPFVQITTGTLQPGTTNGFNVSSGTAVNFNSANAKISTATLINLAGTIADVSTTTHSGAHTVSSMTVNGYFNYLGLMSYKRPRLEWISTTQVNIETNTATANQTQILFRDGELRTVTENVANSPVFRAFFTSRTAAWASGTIQSGIDSGSVVTNTWYALYAVKVTSGTPNQNFVVVGSTFIPIVSRQAELNSRFGTYGWVYLGLVHYGDGGGTNNVLLRFDQVGNFTSIRDAATSSSVSGQALLSTTTASATSISVVYSAGVGNQQIPDNIGIGVWCAAMGTTAGTTFNASDQSFSNNLIYVRAKPDGTVKTIFRFIANPSVGVAMSASTGVSMDISLVGWWDNALGVGPNPPF